MYKIEDWKLNQPWIDDDLLNYFDRYQKNDKEGFSIESTIVFNSSHSSHYFKARLELLT